MRPIQAGETLSLTYADVEDLSRDTGFSPDITIEEGIAWFVE
jgi:nucleoside-diphosphate-sugar epimerase